MGYKAKHAKKTKTNHIKKSASLLAALILMIVVGAGTTLAYIIDTTGSLTNTFLPSQVTCSVNTDKSIKNTGDVDAYIRAAVVITWKNGDGDVYGQKPMAGTDYTISLNDTAQASNVWVKGSDGFYYWTSPVAVNASTNPLIASFSPIAEAPAGYTLSLEILTEAIQATPATVVTSSWTSGVSDVSGTTLQIIK